MNVFSRRMTNHQTWVFPVTLMSAVLGFMVMTAVVTAQKGRVNAPVDPDQTTRLRDGSWDEQEKIKDLNSEVAKLQKDKTALQTALSSKNDSSQILNEQLQDLKMFAVLTDIEGPGVVITLRDGPKKDNPMDLQMTLIDLDVMRVLNELWISGAEAIAVNGLRVTARSNFSFDGPYVVVDGEQFPKPVVIEVVGKAEDLIHGLMLPGGPIEHLQNMDPTMANVEPAKWLRLPAYTGPTAFKVGHLPKVKKP